VTDADSLQASVLLPFFDAEKTLEAALRSVARQREARLECIVVDDGSRDGSPQVAERFAASDPRFRVITLPHGGLVAALNAGLASCRAPIVARMDADDLMHRDRLSSQLAMLATEPALGAVGCHVRIFPRRGLGEGMRAYERWLNAIDSPQRLAIEAFVECPVAHPTLTIRRDVLQALGYRDRGWPEDYDLVLRLLAKGFSIGVVPRKLHAWRHGPRRLSQRSPAYAVERFTDCKAAFLAGGFLGRGDHYVLWGYGSTARALRRALLRHGKRPSHIIELHPGRLGETIHGAPVLPPAALPGLPRRPIVVSVARAGPRGEVRASLATMGFREGTDFICAA
jgi:glycosyltransferase involved in cell wall biosynthesis